MVATFGWSMKIILNFGVTECHFVCIPDSFPSYAAERITNSQNPSNILSQHVPNCTSRMHSMFHMLPNGHRTWQTLSERFQNAGKVHSRSIRRVLKAFGKHTESVRKGNLSKSTCLFWKHSETILKIFGKQTESIRWYIWENTIGQLKKSHHFRIRKTNGNSFGPVWSPH